MDLFESLDLDFPGDLIGRIGNSSPPVIAHDVIVVGPALQPGGRTDKENVKGDVMAFDVRTGKKIWTFHTIPQAGEFGNETWKDGSWKYTGNTGVWSLISADLELGYIYLPVETPTHDFYGGHRLGNNLFGESLVCLEAATGRRVWHFQIVHHGLWDYDPPAAPMISDHHRPCISKPGVTRKSNATCEKVLKLSVDKEVPSQYR